MADFWFGNQRLAEYRPAPNSGMDADYVGLSEGLLFGDGGAAIENSIGTHREYNMAWGVQEAAAMAWLPQYRNGVHGNGLLYFVDPFIENPLPPHWARPELCLEGYPSLVDARVAPVAATTAPNAANLPTRGATFTFTPTDIGQRPWRALVLLVPDDLVLNIGFTGSLNNAQTVLRMDRVSNTGVVSSIDMTLLSAGGTTRMNYAVNGSEYDVVRIYPTTNALGSANITLTSGRAAYSRVGDTVDTAGRHVEGEGHSGLRMDGSPTMTYVQADGSRRLVTYAQKFVEVGSWI